MEKIQIKSDPLLEISSASKELTDFIVEVITFCRKLETQVAELICAKLLVKIRDDLHCVNELVNNGFALQAATVASSLQECLGLLSFIGIDNKKANDFLNHSMENVAFSPFKPNKNDSQKKYIDWSELANSIVINFFSDEKKTEDYRNIWQESYTFFCQAKHNNPMLLKYFYGDLTKITFSYHESDIPDFLGFTALHMSVHFSLLAITNFLHHFQPSDATPRRKTEILKKLHGFSSTLKKTLPKVENPQKDVQSA